jgi:histidyl-tRNA synthetase
MAEKVEPRIFKGTRDFLPREMAMRLHAISALRDVFELYGFLPLETPAFEYLDVLTGKSGSEEDKLIFPLAYKGGKVLGLRYDLTVPLSRVMAMHGPSLPKPFKRYQIQPVWRADKPQKGRFREFWQCDIDTVGSPAMTADAEIALLVETAMTRLGFVGWELLYNNRKVITGLMEAFGVPEDRRVAVCKAVDKLEKIGPENVIGLLSDQGLGAEAAQNLLAVVTASPDEEKDFARMEEALGGVEAGLEGVGELREVRGLVTAVSPNASWFRFAPDMVRGLDYYTGPIFEIRLTESGLGSLGGGGRYDRLIGDLGGGEGYPAVGFAFGLERIILALSNRGEENQSLRGAEVLVTVFSPDLADRSLMLGAALRRAGLRTEVYVDVPRKIGRQFKLADRKGIPVTVIIGPEEGASGSVKIKDMRTGEQVTAALDDAAEVIRRMLGETP